MYSMAKKPKHTFFRDTIQKNYTHDPLFVGKGKLVRNIFTIFWKVFYLFNYDKQLHTVVLIHRLPGKSGNGWQRAWTYID